MQYFRVLSDAHGAVPEMIADRDQDIESVGDGTQQYIEGTQKNMSPRRVGQLKVDVSKLKGKHTLFQSKFSNSCVNRINVGQLQLQKCPMYSFQRRTLVSCNFM